MSCPKHSAWIHDREDCPMCAEEAKNQRSITAFVVYFRRQKPPAGHRKGYGEEKGLFIGRDTSDKDGVIVDMDGKVVPAPIWDYTDAFYQGTLIVRE